MSGTIRRTVEPAHLSGPEGRTLHAANDCGKTLYRATQECLTGPEKEMAPACHGGGSGGSYDLPRWSRPGGIATLHPRWLDRKALTR